MKTYCSMTSVVNHRNRAFFASKKARLVTPVSLCFLLVLFLAGCDSHKAEVVYAIEGKTMGTSYHIKAIVPGTTENQLSEDVLKSLVDKRLVDVNQAMSTYIADSELSLINKMPKGNSVPISAELLRVLSLSQLVSEQTGGAFDITVGPLVNLWGFGPNEMSKELPSDELIAKLKQDVGYQYLQLSKANSTLLKQRSLYIDLSSIAKGYGVDVVAELLEAQNIQNYMVEIGGELRIKGKSPRGKAWRIGVENPTLVQSGSTQAVSAESAGIATSGDYRNYWELEGKRYSHTIDPETGKPVTHTLASVTVLAENAAKADAYATAVNVLGPEKGLAFTNKHGIAAFFIVRAGETFQTFESDNFNQYKVEL